jgi:hypothetical protein
MTIETPTGRPTPVPDAASQPFFDAAREGTLLLKFCPTCNRYLVPSAEVCDSCFDYKIDWRESSGKGTIYSFVLNHQVVHPGFKDLVPYSVIVVELEEGPRLTSTYDGPHDEIKVDMPVRVTFEDLGEVSVPKFTRA